MNTRKLSRYLSKWCKQNGFDVSVRYGTEFAFQFDIDTLNYNFCYDEEQENIYRNILVDKGLNYNCDSFITSFFHELGHYETIDEWSEKECRLFTLKKQTLDGNYESDNIKYFTMPDELRATQWAIDFINENPDKVAKFWQTVQRMILEIYAEEEKRA